MPFWVALADNSQAGHPIVSASIRMLIPGPVDFRYPEERYGTDIPTADGPVIVQQPGQDNRKRAWLWDGHHASFGPYEAQWRFLQSLRSLTRYQGGASPYIYVRENETRGLLKRRVVQFTVAASGSTTTALTLTASPSADIAMGQLEVLSTAAGGSGVGAFQTAQVLSASGSVVTLRTPLSTIPHGARISITYFTADYYRARVVGVDRLRDSTSSMGKMRLSAFEFVIDDASFGVT